MLQGLRNRFFGDRGERLAARYLKRQGMKILVRQWHGRSGEVDLIARDGRTTVFVEVKTRRVVIGTRPEEAVDRRKRQNILRLSQEWARLQQRRGVPMETMSFRFDVVAIVWPDGEPPHIKHIRGAFDAG